MAHILPYVDIPFNYSKILNMLTHANERSSYCHQATPQHEISLHSNNILKKKSLLSFNVTASEEEFLALHCTLVLLTVQSVFP
jgi:hypothetical protein